MREVKKLLAPLLEHKNNPISYKKIELHGDTRCLHIKKIIGYF